MKAPPEQLHCGSEPRGAGDLGFQPDFFSHRGGSSLGPRFVICALGVTVPILEGHREALSEGAGAAQVGVCS